MNHYEKAKDMLQKLPREKVHVFAEWYLGDESYSYKEGAANGRLRLNCMDSLYNESKGFGPDSLEMHRVYSVLDYILTK